MRAGGNMQERKATRRARSRRTLGGDRHPRMTIPLAVGAGTAPVLTGGLAGIGVVRARPRPALILVVTPPVRAGGTGIVPASVAVTLVFATISGEQHTPQACSRYCHSKIPPPHTHPRPLACLPASTASPPLPVLRRRHDLLPRVTRVALAIRACALLAVGGAHGRLARQGRAEHTQTARPLERHACCRRQRTQRARHSRPHACAPRCVCSTCAAAGGRH